MTMTKLASGVMLLALCGVAVAGAQEATQQAAADTEFSKANQLLFMSDHLTDAKAPMVYVYELTKTTTREDEKAFTDEIRMVARDAEGGDSKAVTIDYLSGERSNYVDNVEHARGNPIVMLFLQRDVNEMDRLTGGHWRYFQRRIKTALEHGATVEPVTIEFQGESVQAQRISLTPFAGETRREMKDYVDKRYVFILSEAVPGEVVEMRAVVPGEDKPVIEERLTLVKADPLK